ncbi:MAG: hypothetical protein ACREQN_15830 [Candidatus Binataceae bacterium]
MKGLFNMFGLAMVAASIMLSGCVFIESSNIGGRSATGQAVSASSDGWGILRLTTPQGMTGSVNSQLASACPSGKFTNPQTELSMRDFIIAQLYTVSSNAVCE